MTVKEKLVKTLGGKSAAEKHRAEAVKLDDEMKRNTAERSSAADALEEAAGSGEDTSGLAEKILAADQKLRALSLRRAPLTKLIAEADEAAAAKALEEKRAAMMAELEALRVKAPILRAAAVGAWAESIKAAALLSRAELKAERLAGELKTFGLGIDASADGISQDAAALSHDLGGMEPE